MNERAKNNLELTKRKLDYAEKFFAEKDFYETIHYIWVVFENCINIIKDVKNNRPLYEHKPKIDLFGIYCSIGILKNDYSSCFLELEKLRIRAASAHIL